MTTNQLAVRVVMERTLAEAKDGMMPCMFCGHHFNAEAKDFGLTILIRQGLRGREVATVGLCPTCVLDMEERIVQAHGPAALRELAGRTVERLASLAQTP